MSDLFIHTSVPSQEGIYYQGKISYKITGLVVILFNCFDSTIDFKTSMQNETLRQAQGDISICHAEHAEA